MPLNRRVFIFTLVALLCAIFMLTYALANRSATSSNTLGIYQVQTGHIESSLFLQGTLDFKTKAVLSAETIAKVADIYTAPGARVIKNEVLLRLDDSELRKDIEKQKIMVEQRKIDAALSARQADLKKMQVHKLQQLNRDKYVQQDDFERAQIELDIALMDTQRIELHLALAQKELEKLQLMQQKTAVKSPIDGVVTDLAIDIGETAIASVTGISGSALVTVIDPDSLYVKSHITERDLDRVRLGQETIVKLRNSQRSQWVGKLVFIDNVLKRDPQQPENDGILLHIAVSEAQQTMISGMSADIEIKESSRVGSLLVPMQAVLMDNKTAAKRYIKGGEQHYFVLTVQHDKVVKRPVELGVSDGTYYEVLDGLTADEQVLVAPTAILRDVLRQRSIAGYATSLL